MGVEGRIEVFDGETRRDVDIGVCSPVEMELEVEKLMFVDERFAIVSSGSERI
jgi:hypothetical protein